MKTISIRQLATIKRVAQNVNYAVTKKNKIAAKIEELNKEYNELMTEIDGHERGIKILTGHSSEELVVKVVKDTGKTDKEGKPIKVTTYEPIPEILVYNESTKVYEIHDNFNKPTTNEEEIDSLNETVDNEDTNLTTFEN